MLKFLRHFLPLATIILLPTVLCAQDPRFRIQQITTRDGLSQAIVSCVMQDRYGFIWFGTRGGLDKFDGYRFRSHRYDGLNSTTLGDQAVRTVTEDSSGHIWVGSYTGMLSRMDRRTERCKRFPNDPRNPVGKDGYGITWLGTDHQGTVWIGSTSILSSYDAHTGSFKHYPLRLPPAAEVAPFIDRTGNLWICVSSHAVDSTRSPKGTYIGRYNPATGTFSKWSIPSGIGLMRILGQRANGLLDIAFRQIDSASQPLLFVFDPITRTCRSFDVARRPDHRAGDIIVPELVDAHSEYWYMVRSEAHGLDVAPRLFCQPLAPWKPASAHARRDSETPMPVLYANASMCITDRSETIWIGTENGAIRVSRIGAGFTTWRHDSTGSFSLAAGLVRSVHVDRKGTLWAGTTAGLSRYEPLLHRWHQYHADPSRPGSLPSNTVNVMAEDFDGTLLLGTYAGPVAYDARHDRFVLVPPTFNWRDKTIIKDKTVWSILRDRQKRLWVGTRTGGIRLFDSTGHLLHSFKHAGTDSTSIPEGGIWCMHQDRLGTIWIGTNGGLCRWMPETNSFRHYRHQLRNPHSIGGNNIWAIHEDSVGVLWFCAYGDGISRYDRSRDDFKTMTERDGLPSNNVFGILEESQEVFWVSTTRGLVRWDRRADSNSFRLYDVRDGLQGNEFSFEAFFKRSDGTLYFGGVDGLSAFKPQDLQSNPFTPPICITAFRVFDSVFHSELVDGDTILLQYKQNFFSIEFAALDYINPGKNQYKYMLEGVDPDWVSTGSDHRIASYTNVAPGTYTFRVCGSNNDGLWNKRGIAVTIIIVPPWWRTPWFYGGAALLAIGLVGAGMTMRIRGVRKHEDEKRVSAVRAALAMQEKERRRIGRELHDGVGQKLAAAVYNLAGLWEVLRRDDDVEPERVVQTLDLTIGILGGASGDLRAVSHALGTSTLEEYGLVAAIAEVLASISPDCATHFELIAVGFEERLPQIVETGLFRVAQELIANVLKHSRATEATVQLIREGVEVRLMVEDNGIGFDPATVLRGMGMRNIIERVELMGGTLDIDSTPGHGTTVMVTINVEYAS